MPEKMINWVTMLLAQGPAQPDGNVDDRLVLSLGLTRNCQIDVEAFQAASSPWLATHRVGSTGHKLEVIRIDEGWALQSVEHEDDPIWTFDGHLFRPGELVRVRRPDRQVLLYRIVAVDRADPARPQAELPAAD